MPFTVIRGTFHVVGYEPDGDSFKFKAKRESNWAELSGPKVEMNSKGHVQLRFEAIDALETHYQGAHQPKKLADVATDLLLDMAGIQNVKWGPKHRRVSKADDGVDGFILSRAAEKFHRAVCFVYAGTTDLEDGSEMYLKAPLLKKSLNYKLVQAGLVYPTYYYSLFSDLREVITAAVEEARSAHKGLWAKDKSDGVTVSSLKSITDVHPILPKLFRRLVVYVKSHPSVAGFKQHLADNPEEVLILPQAHVTHFDTIIKQQGKRIGLTVLPENLVFKP